MQGNINFLWNENKIILIIIKTREEILVMNLWKKNKNLSELQIVFKSNFSLDRLKNKMYISWDLLSLKVKYLGIEFVIDTNIYNS